MLKTVYDELIKNVNAIDNSKFAKKEIMMLKSVIFEVEYLILLV